MIISASKAENKHKSVAYKECGSHKEDGTPEKGVVLIINNDVTTHVG